MLIYLAQHGEARSKEEDPERPLTGAGRDDVGWVARRLEGGIALEELWHSGKRRAEETAAIFADHLRPHNGMRVREGLSPTDDPGAIRDALETASASVMLVGHLPHLDRLASLLLAGDAEGGLIRFENGGVLCLERSGSGGWSVRWYLTPELARD